MIRSRLVVAMVPSLFFFACGGSQPAAPETPTPPATEEAPPPPAEAATTDEAKPAEGEGKPEEGKPEEAKAPEQKPVEVKIEARSGSKVSGTATLEPVPEGVKVTLHLKGMPAGNHGAHIHEKADCSAKDGTSAGGHFNPDSHKHGLPPGEERHLGDLGNIVADKKGEANLEIVIKGANLIPGDPHSFLDRGIIIHQKKDDGGQPVGNAGGRIGCGEIKAQ
jgi:Cu-Zn family superoxide dismutase